jgi:hypothetical protein
VLPGCYPNSSAGNTESCCRGQWQRRAEKPQGLLHRDGARLRRWFGSCRRPRPRCRENRPPLAAGTRPSAPSRLESVASHVLAPQLPPRPGTPAESALACRARPAASAGCLALGGASSDLPRPAPCGHGRSPPCPSLVRISRSEYGAARSESASLAALGCGPGTDDRQCCPWLVAKRGTAAARADIPSEKDP